MLKHMKKLLSLLLAIHCCAVNSDNNKFRIYKNELLAEQQTFIFTNVLLAVNEFGSCQAYALIADKMAEQLNNKYGKDWFCLCGKNLIEPNFNTAPNSFIWLSYENTQIMIFKPSGVTELDLIFESRLKTSVTLLDTEMDQHQQEQTLAITSFAICKHNDFESIAQNITNSLNLKYGLYWRCSVSSSSGTQPTQDNEVDTTHAPKTLLSFKIGDIMFNIYKTNHPQFKMSCEEVVSRARNEEVRINGNENIDSDIEQKVIESAKQAISQCNTGSVGSGSSSSSSGGGNGGNCYDWISRSLQESLNRLLWCECGCKWSVISGVKYFYGTHFNAFKSSLRFNFGQLYFTVTKF